MRRLALAAAALLVASCTSLQPPSDREVTYTVIIPAGTSEAGDSLALLQGIPQERTGEGLSLLLSVGESLIVSNQDEVDHTIGLVVARPGETINYRFSVPGEFVGACTLLAGERLTLVVS